MKSTSETADVLALVEELKVALSRARKVPLMEEMYFVNAAELLEIVGDIQSMFPQEVESAREVLRNQEKYVAEAQRRAQEFKKNAEAEVRRFVQKQEIVRMAREAAAEIEEKARQEGEQIVRAAHEEAEQIREDVLNKADGYFRRADSALVDARDSIRNAWTNF